ncbi:hypothetical protein CLAFUW4_04393 [Fulvia fulva]|uniref:Antigenic cell wall galactomannoprotein n=1 Tax=Passalora fulva TaxID=5499 RepID=A0A9Q8P7A5_PASFU|nr:uncharacterized protein CLAFUR5_04356 [Fulvia fulva]KAK4626123.1 hypothetical protein CLAFUR4_04379 [Fulvia fulva]KAK4628495.1 hypothetical protein CLAFUR0_04381 [Fulvia fulva]UJO15692.1 hypothetical protein CLAFUR5_04356 [Fulvia fulva]WPV13526.1 hypothetical protein CLAFUW4_04393 [Fulvia fulva]WPV28183.1 hypothetical protein CLAFUW7_04383 [Fulvia fulva]
MRSVFFTGLLATLAIASPIAVVEKRGAANIAAALDNVSANIKTVNSTLSTFNKGDLDSLIKVLKIQQQTKDLGESLKTATSAAEASEPLDDAGSLTIGLAILNDLLPDTTSLLTKIESKKPAFDAAVLGIASVSATVKKSLVEQKQQSAELGQAITAKLTPAFANLAPGINQQIADKFTEAINIYSQPGGLIPLPALPFKE